MKLDSVHILTFAVGVAVGWLVLPMLLGMFAGGVHGSQSKGA